MHTITYNRLENSIDVRLAEPLDDSVLAFLKRHFIKREFVRESRCWRIPLEDSQALKIKVQQFCSFLVGTKQQQVDLHQNVMDAIEILEDLKNQNVQLSNGIYQNQLLTDKFPSLTPQMHATAEYVFRNGAGVIVGDNVELYNARLSTWAAVETLGQWLPALILCQDKDKFTWGMMIKKSTGHSSLILDDFQKQYREITGEVEEGRTTFAVCIENFGGMEKHQSWLTGVPWKSVIVDGGHHIKSGSSIQAEIIRDIVQHVDRRIILSQTPMTQPYLWVPQLEIINRLEDFITEKLGGRLDDRIQFLNRYQSGWWRHGPQGTEHGIGDPSHLEEFNRKMRENCFVRHE